MAIVVLAIVAVIAVARALTPPNPFDGRALYLDPDSSAAVANREAGGAFDRIASTPAAIWLLPERHSTAEITGYVQSVVADAKRDGALPVFVVYGIPDRDCGNHSQGGLEAAEYPEWVSAIAEGLAQAESVVILEPDALPLSAQCGNTDQRVAQIADARSRLAQPGTTLYLDAGHSAWLPAEQMAALLNEVGMDSARGFATNVSNYNATDAERAYAERVSELTGGAHYVIDISRNGNGSNGDWCNPSGRALGEAPRAVGDGSRLDALIWVKLPGESDGSCNGGPPAGQWWDAAARALIAAQ